MTLTFLLGALCGSSFASSAFRFRRCFSPPEKQSNPLCPATPALATPTSVAASLLALFALSGAAQVIPPPVQHIRQTHTLSCAIDQAVPEYTTLDPHGPRIAFDLELCHAVAVAVAGPEAKVRPLLVPDESSAVAALLAGKAELIPTLSLDLTHSTTPGLLLGPPTLLDGTGLLVPVAVPTPSALSGKKVCFFAETETELVLQTWFRLHRLDLLAYPFSEEGEMQAGFTSGNCAAIAGDFTRLAATLDGLGSAASRYKILPDNLAPDPLAPAATDPQLARIAAWTFELLLNASALGVTRASLPRQLKSDDPALARLFGRTHELGPALGLDDAWPIRVLAAVGNYAELSARTLSTSLPQTLAPAPLPLK